jgi:protein-tyrosine-phosphatase
VVVDLLTELRGVPEKVLHPLHRRRAFEALRRRPPPASLLVVCRGNRCRSPFAALLLGPWSSRRRVRVDSAGFVAPDRPPPAAALVAAARHGVDLSRHRSRLLTADRTRAADLIVVMDPDQQRAICRRFGRAMRDVLVLGDLDPRPSASRAIRDPVNQPLAVFEEVFGWIERCVRELERAIGSEALGVP